MTGAEQRIFYAMHAGFFLLLAASASRLVARHGLGEETAARLVLCGALAVLYAAGILAWDALDRRRLAWLAIVVGVWVALVVLAPSFAWCAIPLFFICLRLLPPRATIALVLVLTGTVIFAQVRLAPRFEPSLVLAPIAVAAMITVIFLELQRLIDDLVRTRGELAATQRAAGVLEERERLAREIHDTLAQGLTSTGLLLQAADRSWASDPEAAHRHLRQAALAVTGNLDEARRFVRDLTPPDLVAGSLPAALRALAGRTAAESGLDVLFRMDGTEYGLDEDVQSALLRIAQGALANVREHAQARQAVVTLTFLDDEVTLDVLDDGVGWDGSAPGEGRGYGLRAMRDRLTALGGRLVIESAPGDGTAVAAIVPLGSAGSGR